MRGLSDDERALLNHWSRFGSDGYPIRKLGNSGRCWVWGPWRSVKGPPTTFKTKREAVASFEAFIDVLIEAKGEEAHERANAELRHRQRTHGADCALVADMGSANYCTCGAEGDRADPKLRGGSGY